MTRSTTRSTGASSRPARSSGARSNVVSCRWLCALLCCRSLPQLLWSAMTRWGISERVSHVLGPMDRSNLNNVASVVLKVGSGVLVRDGTHFDRGTFCRVVEQIAALVGRGLSVALVSSGAVALGRARIGTHERPDRERSLP